MKTVNSTIKQMRAAAAAAGVVAGVSCAVGDETSTVVTFNGLAEIREQVVSPLPVECGLGRRWSGGSESLSFISDATIVCRHTLRDLPVNVQLELEPLGETGRFVFRAISNDAPLPIIADPSGTLRVHLSLEPRQRAVVTLVRDVASGQHADAGIHENHFGELRVVADGREVASFSAGLSTGQRVMSAFLDRGIAGIGTRKARGVMVRGGADLVLAVAEEEPAVFRVQPHNISRRPAVFSVGLSGGEMVEERVDPEGYASLSVKIPAGAHQLVLRVRGTSDGLHLWGAPHLVREADHRPWVILLTLDTTRRDALGPWGAPAGTTPNLDRLASSGTVFDSAWASAPWTLPSHASIFSGLHPSEHRAGVSADALPTEVLTLAEVLSSAGWFTAGLAGGEMCASHWGLAQGFDVYGDPDGFESTAEVQTEAALELLEDHPGGPVFLFVNYFDPHALFRAPRPYADRFNVAELAAAIPPGTEWAALAAGSGEAWRAIVAGEAPPGPAELAWLAAAYRAEVAFMDAEIGRLLSVLEDRGVLDDAVVIAVADHGELLGEDGFFSHGCRLDTELTWVPLIVRGPGMARGGRDSLLASHVDLLPTVLELVGLPVAVGDGVSLSAKGVAARSARQDVLSEEHEYRNHPFFVNMEIAKHLYALQGFDHRWILWDAGASCERLVHDDWLDTACADQHLRDRYRDLEGIRVSRGDGHVAGGGQDGLSVDDRKRLEALGYIR